MIAQNIKDIRQQIQDACRRVGRNTEDVQLVGVTKTFGSHIIEQALQEGLSDFGESYVQELSRKRAQLIEKPIRWHFIGRLQSNKVKYIIDYVHLIHSVDNVRVVEEIQKRGEKVNRTIDILVEVHTTDETTKAGVMPEKTVAFVREISTYHRVHVIGLMTMGPFSNDPNDSRPSFQRLKELRDTIVHEAIPNVAMQHLSMGMSHDYLVAIEEGATIVRVGTALFGGRAA